jgi:hypothetical protein
MGRRTLAAQHVRAERAKPTRCAVKRASPGPGPAPRQGEGRADPRHDFWRAALGETQLQAEVLKLRRRIRALGFVVALLPVLLRVSGFRLEARLMPPGPARTTLLRAVQRAREWLPLRAVLRLAGISSSRLSAWKVVEGCCPSDRTSCPRRTPNQLTANEVITIHEMVTSTEYRHVPTSRLAILAQRLGKVFASPTTWARLVRQCGWRRARQRVRPEKPARRGPWAGNRRQVTSRAAHGGVEVRQRLSVLSAKT